jgi:2-polyprenyl-3-methyl-5-hydroxy-6-metoxy-1,4-benzoquinol methylase
MISKSQNKTNKEYWDQSWSDSNIRSLVQPDQLSLRNYPRLCWHQWFSEIFANLEANNLKILEIGCARSIWLPYFAKEFGFDIYGLDYSEIGCKQEEQLLNKAGVKGKIVCADLFNPPAEMIESFDIVVSFGVAEHFINTTDCIKAFSKFLKQGGMMITIIPNMIGAVGWFQKVLNPPIFDIHVLLDVNQLSEAHKKADLEVSHCNYFMSTHFAVCNLNGINSNSLEWLIKKGICLFLVFVSVSVWFVESKIKIFKLKENRLTSPYINCIAIKS